MLAKKNTTITRRGSLPAGRFKVCWIFLLSLLLCPSPIPLSARTYYVDATEGNDSYEPYQVSIEHPWKTLNKISRIKPNTFKAGDRILFKRGEIWHDSLTIPASGEQENPVIFGAYPDTDSLPLPVFDGATIDAVSWSPVAGKENCYRTATTISEPGVLIYKGSARPAITTLRFNAPVPDNLQKGAILIQYQVSPRVYTNLWVTSKQDNLISGITFFNIKANTHTVYVRQRDENNREVSWPEPLYLEEVLNHPDGLTEPGHWYWDRNEQRVYLYSKTVPNGSDVQLGSLSNGIMTYRHDFLRIENIRIRNFSSTGVLIDHTTGAIVHNLKVSAIGANGFQTGILIKNSDHNQITDNKVDAVLRSCIGIFASPPADGKTISENNLISNNTVTNCGSSGISLNTDYRNPDIARNIKNNIIENNTIQGVNTFSYDAAGIYTLYIGSGNILRANIIKNGGSSVLRSAGIMIDGGAITVPEGKNSVIIEQNIIENNSLAGIAASGDNHQIINNTLRDNGSASWESAQILFFAAYGSNASSCTVRQNLMEVGKGQRLVAVLNDMGPGSSPHNIDYNTYSSNALKPFCLDRWVCGEGLNYVDWKTVSGQDLHSTYNRQTPVSAILLGVFPLLL